MHFVTAKEDSLSSESKRSRWRIVLKDRGFWQEDAGVNARLCMWGIHYGLVLSVCKPATLRYGKYKVPTRLFNPLRWHLLRLPQRPKAVENWPNAASCPAYHAAAQPIWKLWKASPIFPRYSAGEWPGMFYFCCGGLSWQELLSCELQAIPSAAAAVACILLNVYCTTACQHL